MPDVNTDFGRRLREARVAEHLSQEDVARTVGLSRTSITNIEAGRQHIALDQLYALATAVRRTPSELLPEYVPTVTATIPGLDSELARRNISHEFAGVVNSIMQRAYAEAQSGSSSS